MGVDPGEPQLGIAGEANWYFTCPTGYVGAGWDYEGPSVLFLFFADITQGTGPSNYNVVTAENGSTATQAFRPHLGCIPPAASASRARAAAVRANHWFVEQFVVRPGRTRVYTHRCPVGRRLLAHAYGIGWHKNARPSRRELNELHPRLRVRNGRIFLRLVTGPHVGDNERVELQLHARCWPR
jgi:hypothetical protein